MMSWFVRIHRFLIIVLTVFFAVFGQNVCHGQALAVGPELIDPVTGAPVAGDFRLEWMNADDAQKKQIAEEIGEKGARDYAQRAGYKTIFDGRGRMLPQGPDQVYFDPKTGEIVVIEAKGGTSALCNAYSYPQGTPQWAVKSAEKVLHSSNASAAEKQAAARIVEAARTGKLRVEVIRTPHILGTPKPPVLEPLNITANDFREAAKLAEEIGQRYRLNGWAVREAGEGTSRGPKTPAKRVLQAAEEGGVPMKQSGQVPRAAMAAEQAAGKSVRGTSQGVKAAAAEVRAASEAASVVRGLNRAAKVAGPAAAAVDAGTRVYESYKVEESYRKGTITEQERNLEHAKNAAGFAGGWAGAWVGGKVCGTAGAAIGTAVCPGLGTAIGGAVGGVAGAVGGYFAGEKMAEAGTEAIMKQ